jgi:hypothetical protein
MSICTKCKVDVDTSQMCKSRSYCKKCWSDYMKAYYDSKPEKRQQNRTLANDPVKNKLRRTSKYDFIWKIKCGPCVDCGQKFHPFAMDFDHRPGADKKDHVSVLTGKKMNLDVIQAEVNKCDLVCSNCHRIRTIKRLRGINSFTYWSNR